MKQLINIFSLCFYLLLITNALEAQTPTPAWEYQGPVGEASEVSLEDAAYDFISDSLGFIIAKTDVATYLHKTSDGADNWETIEASNINSPVDLKFFNETNAVALHQNFDDNLELVRSEDGGVSWSPSILFGDNSNREQLVIWENSAMILRSFFMDNEVEVYYTNDMGINWEISSIEFPSVEQAKLHDLQMTGPNSAIAVISEGPNSLSVDSYNIMETTDGGQNWQTIAQNTDNIGDYFYGISYLGNEELYMCVYNAMGTDPNYGFSLYHHLNDNWTSLDINDLETSIKDIHFINSSVGFMVGSNSSDIPDAYLGKKVLLKTTDGGLTWKEQGAIHSTEDSSPNGLILDFIDDEIAYFIAEGLITIEDTNEWATACIFKTTTGGTAELLCTPPLSTLDICVDILEEESYDNYELYEATTTFNCSIESINDSCFTFTPLPAFNGVADVITTFATFNSGGNVVNSYKETYQVQVSNLCNEMASITPLYYQTDENTALTIAELFGDEEGLSENTPPDNGELTYNDIDKSFTYTPSDDFVGMDEFTIVSYDVMGNVYYQYDVLVSVGDLDCEEESGTDCVWPGDANNDGIANNFDLLNLGIANGGQGFARASESIDWEAYAAADWPVYFAGELNTKYADCDGNGVINAIIDMEVIEANYGLTHNKTESTNDEDGIPFVIELPLLENVAVGTQIVSELYLGTTDTIATNTYGIAFSIFYDPIMIAEGSVDLDLSESWLGEENDLLSLTKLFHEDGQIDIAITRTDQQSIDGSGLLGHLSFVTDDIIAGKMTEELWLNMTIANVKLIDHLGIEKSVNAKSDSLMVTATTDILNVNNQAIKIYPNPCSDILYLELSDREEVEAIEIRSIDGRKIQSFNPSTQAINVNSLKSGVYYINIITASNVISKKLFKN